MRIYRLFPVFILITMCSLLSACLGESLPLTEEEKQNLALLNAVNSDKQNTTKTDKNIQLSLLDAHQVEEKPEMTFKLVLTKAAKEDISVSIHLDTRFTHQDAQATENVDFSLPNLTSISIPAGKTATQFKVQVLDDNLIEATEQFKLVVSNLKTKDGSVKLLKTAATGTILDNEVWRGYIKSPDQKLVKLDSNGNELDITATTWSCVKDKRTGLIWEVKTAKVPDNLRHDPNYIYNPKYLHDKIWSYGSFDLRYLDGEYEGQDITGKTGLTQEQLYGKDNVFAGDIDIPVYRKFNGNLWSNLPNICSNKQWICTTHQYTLDVNQGKGLCGFRDWRIPTVTEASSIIRESLGQDTNFFPYKLNFYTKTPSGGYSKAGIYSSGWVYVYSRKSNSFHGARRFSFILTDYNWVTTRLVRGGKLTSHPKANHGYTNKPNPAHPTQIQTINNPHLLFASPTSDYQFIANNNGVFDTVKHLFTGLIWKRCPEQFELSNQGTPKPEDDTCNYTGTNPYISPNWQGILANVPTGWRVPKLKELRSLVDFSKYKPSLNLVVFPDHPNPYCIRGKRRVESLISSTPKGSDSNYGYYFLGPSVSTIKHNPKIQNTVIVNNVVMETFDPKRCYFTRLVKDN